MIAILINYILSPVINNKNISMRDHFKFFTVMGNTVNIHKNKRMDDYWKFKGGEM